MLILVDYKKGNPEVATVLDESSEVTMWFNNHSYALGKYTEEQKSMNDGKGRALISPIVSHWTAHCATLTRLLEVWKPLQVTSVKHGDEIITTVGPKAKAKRKARNVLRRVKNDLWWDKVVMYVTEALLPLHSGVNLGTASKHTSSPSPLP